MMTVSVELTMCLTHQLTYTSFPTTKKITGLVWWCTPVIPVLGK
jgi:hypothetical protein